MGEIKSPDCKGQGTVVAKTHQGCWPKYAMLQDKVPQTTRHEEHVAKFQVDRLECYLQAQEAQTAVEVYGERFEARWCIVMDQVPLLELSAS